MATKRALSKSVSLSQQVDTLSANAQLLFTWMISHADDEGRLGGEPKYVKATVVPLKSWAFGKVEDYLLEMSDNNLIYYWFQAGRRFIEFPKWKDHQTLQVDRGLLSKIPSFNSQKAKDAKEFPELPKNAGLNQQSIQEVIKVETQYKLNRYNIRGFKAKEDKIKTFIKVLDKELKFKPTDIRIPSLFKYYTQKCKEKKGFEPEINFGKEGFLLKIRLKRYSELQIQSLIIAFLDSDESSRIGSSLSVILSSVIINKWLDGQLKKKVRVGKIS